MNEDNDNSNEESPTVPIPLPIEKSKPKPTIKHRKTTGHKIKKVKQKSIYYFNKINSQINKALKLSNNIHPVNPKKYGIQLKEVLSRTTLDKLRNEEYNKRWKIIPVPILPNVKNATTLNNSSSASSLFESNSKQQQKITSYRSKSNDTDILDRLYGHKKPKPFNITSGGRRLDNLKLLKSFNPPQGNLNPAMIMKKSQAELCSKNELRNYDNTLKESLGEYIEYADKFGSIYDLDKLVLEEIKNNKIGLTIPGNFLNYLDDPNNFSYIKAIYPSFVKLKIKKHIVVPDKTQLPKPVGLYGNYSKVSYKDLYSD